MFCDTCLELILEIDRLIALFSPASDRTVQSLPHHRTFDSIVHAAKIKQCVICTRVVHEAPGLIDEDLHQWLRSRGDASNFQYDVLLDLRTWQRNGEISLKFLTQSYGGISVFRLRPLDESITTALAYHQSSPSSFTGDDTVLNVARHWLDHCETVHENCRHHFDVQTVYPARLLDLEPDGLNDGLHFRLIEGHAIQNISGGYVTLSHRWGPVERHPPKLEATSHKSLIQGWPIERLSGTYRDAVKVAKRLGVRYFWVDSLCIFQDERLDILSEALKMATVYGNAICNIAALDARQDGLFSTRDPATVSPLSRILLKTSHTELQKSYAIGDHRLWETSIFGAPLSRRGWILQEQLLARRTLFFGCDQLLWSCISEAWCETYPPEDTIWNNSDFRLGQRHLEPVRLYCAAANRATSSVLRPSPTDAIDSNLKRDFQMAWRHVIEEYVPRELTDPKDKLLAITGIVASYTATQNDECIAGHWKSSFPFNLLWHVNVQGSLRRNQLIDLADAYLRSPVQRVPSWSWASRDGYLVIPGELDRRYCAPIAEVLTVSRQTRTLKNGVSQEEVGPLTLIAPLIPLERTPNGTDETWGFKPLTASPSQQSPDPLGENVETYFDVPDAEIPSPLLAAFISCEVQIPQPPSSTPTIAGVNSSSGSGKTLIRSEGLILHPQPHPSTTTHIKCTRVGHFKFGEIIATKSPSRFMPPHWRFHLDVEERHGRTYTRAPDFGDQALMGCFDIF